MHDTFDLCKVKFDLFVNQARYIIRHIIKQQVVVASVFIL